MHADASHLGPCVHAECKKVHSTAGSSVAPVFKFYFRRLGVEKEEDRPWIDMEHHGAESSPGNKH